MTEQKPIRTRIAPSPTGAPHIGTAYIALFNYAFAKRNAGRFILRIEDTDRARCTLESEQAILEALRWINLPWDEGPDIGGSFGPYRQSERLEIYREHCMELLAAGHAYPCFCTSERLAKLRREQIATEASLGYDGHCESISADEAQRRIESGEPHVVRLRIPSEGHCAFQDQIRGEIKIHWASVDRQILLKSDGHPTYHLANVVDDHLMEISHVIRGEEWISSTPKHVLLYQYFGWALPKFAHLPLLRNPDKSKLSKRKNPTSILYYRDAGYLPEALINYLGLMAYSMPNGEETFARDDLAAHFDFDRISLGGPIFDLQKLAYFNGQYLRRLDSAALEKQLTRWKLNATTWQHILPLAQPRINTFAELVPMTAYFFADKLSYQPTQLITDQLDGSQTAQLLKIAQWEIEETTDWSIEAIKRIFSSLAVKENLKLKTLLRPFFVAITGAAIALPLFESMVILGKDMVLRRLQYALEALAGLGFVLKGKALKQLAERRANIDQIDTEL